MCYDRYVYKILWLWIPWYTCMKNMKEYIRTRNMKNMEEYTRTGNYLIGHANIVTLTTMIRGYTIHIYNKYALKWFNLIKYLGTNHYKITFICILLSWNYGSIENEGYKYFHRIIGSYCIIPMVNLCMNCWTSCSCKLFKESFKIYYQNFEFPNIYVCKM